MEALGKPKIEAIFPLTYMQQGLLFHHLMSGNDQGFLNVSCVFKGFLDLSLFKKAWNQTIRRHAVLRTTVHWKEIEKPVVIVHGEKSADLDYYDWSELSAGDKSRKWKELENTAAAKGVNFTKGPLSKLELVHFGNDEHRLLWPNHHILIDGWSSQIILNDFLMIYDSLGKRQEPVLPTLPSYKAYLNWVGKSDTTAAATFWSLYFENFERAPLFENSFQTNDRLDLSSSSIELSSVESEKLRSLASSFKITLNTLIQGAWSVLLSRYFDTKDLTYGITVSGRSNDFPNVELLTGMYMNVQPVRTVLVDQTEISTWFRDLQRRQQQARKYEHVNLDEIASFIDWPEARPLFDSILIFENFPQARSEDTALEIIDYKSGTTSTYPVTMAVVPDDNIAFTLTVASNVVDKQSFDWIIENWKILLSDLLVSDQKRPLGELTANMSVYDGSNRAIDQRPQKSKDIFQYRAPRNNTELELVKIWEDIFGRHSIGVHDDFFQLGGKSLLAAKMFSIINKQLNVQLPPTTLLEHRTIAAIASFLSQGADLALPSWKNLVPIRAKGVRPALFCIHAGGGHIFFYNLLAEYLNDGRPVYALQPSGIYGDKGLHASIEEMAQAYVEEIQLVQPSGPYNLMVYCFSTAVGLEMSRILESGGFESNLIVMDTMAEQRHLMTKSRIVMRVSGFFKRLSRNPLVVVQTMFADRYHRYIRPFWVKFVGSLEERNTERIRLHLFKIYNRYKWSARQVGIKLVLTKKADKRFNKEYIRSWEEIALDGVEIIDTAGDHRTLFEEPDVQEVAKTIDGILL